MSFRIRRPIVVLLRYARGAKPRSARPRTWGVAGAALPGVGQARPPEGAVVSGRIVDAGAMARRAASSMDALAVRVTGTDICSAVDDLGRFTLHGVPPGTVRLQFTGANVQGHVRIPGVEPRDQVHIAVRMNARRPAQYGRGGVH